MGNRSWKYWLIASILAAALWAAGSHAAEEKAQPKAFNSAVAFNVCAVAGEDVQFVGSTPSERPLTILPCHLCRQGQAALLSHNARGRQR